MFYIWSFSHRVCQLSIFKVSHSCDNCELCTNICFLGGANRIKEDMAIKQALALQSLRGMGVGHFKGPLPHLNPTLQVKKNEQGGNVPSISSRVQVAKGQGGHITTIHCKWCNIKHTISGWSWWQKAGSMHASSTSWALCHMPVAPALWRQKQEKFGFILSSSSSWVI